MKNLITVLAAFLVAHPAFPQFNPPNAGPYKSLVQSAGANCIFALHTDTISGMTCANTSVDGTTETAFAHGVSIPAKTLSNNTITVNSVFLVHTSGGTTPTLTYGLRLGGISGTLIYQSAPVTPASGVANVVQVIPCTITALGAAGATTPLVVGCGGSALLNATIRNNLLSNTTQSVATDVRAAQTLVWTVTYSANTAGNAIGLYSMFNGIK